MYLKVIYLYNFTELSHLIFFYETGYYICMCDRFHDHCIIIIFKENIYYTWLNWLENVPRSYMAGAEDVI